MSLALATVAGLALAQNFNDTPKSISTPDRVETRLGTLEFKDGAPSKGTVEKVYDNLDFMHAVEAFVNAFQGASTSAIWKGFNDAGVADNTVLIFSELYDNQTRSMLQTPQRFPRAGSQSYPTPAAVADADGSTTVFFAPTKPDGVKDGNWVQTDPTKGWNMLFRLYSPLEPFFTKQWRPGEIELVK